MKKIIFRKFLSLILPALILLEACGGTKQQPARELLHPEWSYNAIIYELNTRQFTPEGTFSAAADHLDRLAELGVDLIWFMPIHPIGELERKGELGSYYSVSDYRAVNPEFGTMTDFISFVDRAHQRGMRVIIDWVPNHTSRDAVWLREGRDDWYVMDEDGSPVAPYDWTDVAQLDYNVPEMRAAMIDAMAYWLTETGIDGFRCDVAHEVPVDFWEDASAALRAVKPDIFMLAEAEKADLHLNNAFDMCYAWELHHIMNSIARGEYGADYLRQHLDRWEASYPEGTIRMIFTSNHDENSWNGTEFERMGDAVETMAALTYVLPGMPLIYNGQETGLDKRLEFFERDPIRWDYSSAWTPFYRKMNDLRHDNPALWSPELGGRLVELDNSAGDRVLSFYRTVDGNTVVSVFNLSADNVEVEVDTSPVEGAYTDYITGEIVALSGIMDIETAPWEYKILVR